MPYQTTFKLKVDTLNEICWNYLQRTNAPFEVVQYENDN